MIKFYYNLAPNPMKVALFLEEAHLAYELRPIDTRRGEQHTPEYRAINPNGKVPAIVDGYDTVFDSNAILLYLAEKTGQFLPERTPGARGKLYSWLMFVATGVGPYSGQAVHFRHHAPEQIPYAVERYQFEAKRHYGILDDRLAMQRYMLGDLHDRRHGGLGLGAAGAVHPGRRRLDARSQRQTAGGRNQRAPRGRAGCRERGKRRRRTVAIDRTLARHDPYCTSRLRPIASDRGRVAQGEAWT